MAPPRRRTALTLHFRPLTAVILLPFSIARHRTGGRLRVGVQQIPESLGPLST